MGLDHILRGLFGGHNSHRGDHHGHHGDYHHHDGHHDYHHHDRHHDYHDDYDSHEECNSATNRGSRYQPVSQDATARHLRVVICLSCEAENPDNAKFCIECGSVLRMSRSDWG